MAEDLISSIIDEAAIKAQIVAVEKDLDGLIAKIKTFNIPSGGANSIKELTKDNKIYASSLTEISQGTRKVLDAEKLAAIERKRIVDERIQQAKLEKAELQIQQTEIKKKILLEKEAAQAAKVAAAESTSAGRERILQLKAEQQAAQKAAESNNQRSNAENQALSGTYNTGYVRKSNNLQNSAPLKLTVDQGNIALVKSYEGAIAKLTAEQKLAVIAFKNGEISQNAYKKQMIEGVEKVNNYKRNIADLNKEIKLSADVNNSERNSLARAQALIAQYTNSKKNLNLATKEGALLNDNYNKAIAKTNAFILANADAETVRTKSVGGYTKGIQKAFSGLRTLANILPGIGLSGIFLLGFEAIQKAVEALGLFNSKLTDSAVKADILNKSFETSSFTDAVKNVENLRIQIGLAKDGFVDKTAVVKLYNETIGKSTGEIKTLTQAEKFITDSAESYIKMTLFKAAANLALEDAAKKALAAEQKRAKDVQEFNTIGSRIKTFGAGQNSAPGFVPSLNDPLAAAKANAASAEKVKAKAIKSDEDEKNTLLNIAKKFNEDAAKIAKDFKFIPPETVKKAAFTKASTKTLLDSDFEEYKIDQKRKIDFYKDDIGNQEKANIQRLNALDRYLTARRELIERETQEELRKNAEKQKALETNLPKAKGTEKNNLLIEIKNNATARNTIEAKANDESVRLQKEVNGLLLGLYKDFSKQNLEIAKTLYDKQLEIIKQFVKEQEKAEQDAYKKEIDFIAKKKELYKQLYKEIQQTVFQFYNDGLKREEQDLDEKKRLLDENTKRRIIDINQLGLTEIERVKQTAAVEKDAQFQTEQIEKRKRAIAVERAKFEKAASIASIIATTAQAVVANLKVGPPQGFILAALAGAIGALQLARAISTPLPKYKEGTERANKGLAIYGEVGRELVIPTQGRPFLSPGIPTLTNLMGGEKIIPADITQVLLNSIGMKGLSGMSVQQPATADGINSHLMNNMLGELKDINRKSRIIIQNEPGIESKAWYQYHIKN